MVYAVLDPVIKGWVNKNELKLATEFAGEERRFCYVTGGPQECFQVSIEPPQGSEVVVNAWSIETIDDAELHESWLVHLDELGTALDLAFDKIKAWNARLKGPATWQPPASWENQN
jgi:hypothetical protein